MTDAPKIMWGIPYKDTESPYWLGRFWSIQCSEDDERYIRFSDHEAALAAERERADALVAAAYEDAAKRIYEEADTLSAHSETWELAPCARHCAEIIKDTTITDARAALDRLIEEAERRGAEIAADKVARNIRDMYPEAWSALGKSGRRSVSGVVKNLTSAMLAERGTTMTDTPRLFIDQDGDAGLESSGESDNLVALPARDEVGRIMHPHIWAQMVQAFNDSQDALDRMIEEAEQRGAQSADRWKPIETAPKGNDQ